MPDGESILGSLNNGQKVIIEDGVAKMPDRKAFAGSVATTDRLVRTMIYLAGVPLIDAVRMMTLTPARILVSLVVLGVFLQAVGVYQPLVDYAGAGATVPLLGFGYSLAKGVAKAVAESGLIGVFTGGVTGAAGGIAAAITFGCLFALIAKPKSKS